MKQACIRCVVQLCLNQLRWKDEKGIDIKLTGAPVFVRACVLGQLQHTHLQRPSFPISINQTLTFDRILSNCRNPSLFNEVIRGEHVKLEVIQITPDYKGGKILAKFDCPAHKFLFPNGKEVEEDQRILILNHSRQYKVPPELLYTSSTVLLEATVASPIHVLYPSESTESPSPSSTPSSSGTAAEDEALTLTALRHRRSRSPSPAAARKPAASRKLFSSANSKSSFARSRKTPCSDGGGGGGGGGGGRPRSVSPRRRTTPNTSRLDQSLSLQDRLHSLLSSYVGQRQNDDRGKRRKPAISGSRSQSPYRVTFKPPPPHRSRRELSGEETPFPPPPSSPTASKSPPHYYQSQSRLLGPHDWPECPRRSPKHQRRKKQLFSSSSDRDDSRRRRRQQQQQHRSRSSSPYHRNCVPASAGADNESDDDVDDPTPYHPKTAVGSSPELRYRAQQPPRQPPRASTPPPPPPPRSRSTSPSRNRRDPPQGSVVLRNEVPLYVMQGTGDLQQMDPALSPCRGGSIPQQPPFVVRRVDDSLLSKRNFCGETCVPVGTSVREFSWEEEGRGRSSKEEMIALRTASGDEGGEGAEGGRYPLRGQRSPVPGGGGGGGGVATAGPTKSSPKYPHWSTPPRSQSPVALGGGSGGGGGGRKSPAGAQQLPSSPLPVRNASGGGGGGGGGGGSRRELVSRYLSPQRGSAGGGGGGSGQVSCPKCSIAEKIDRKIERLKKECCEYLHCADNLGEDSLSEDLDRLRASLQGEREEAMEKSTRLMPEKSVTVQLGPRDYWSERMSELTGGTRHRVIFDDTLKKIYSRLYTEASLTP